MLRRSSKLFNKVFITPNASRRPIAFLAVLGDVKEMEKCIQRIQEIAVKRGGNTISNFKVERWNDQTLFISGFAEKSSRSISEFSTMENILSVTLLGTAFTTIGTLIYLFI